MDDTSRAVLARLGAVTRPNVLELARVLGVARNTVQARLDRLESECVLGGYGPVVDLKALGYGVLAFLTLEIAQGREHAVIETLGRIPEVLEVHKITGPGDIMCRVVARSNEHLHDVVSAVLDAPGIVRTTTSLALNSPLLRVHPDADAVAELVDRA